MFPKSLSFLATLLLTGFYVGLAFSYIACMSLGRLGWNFRPVRAHAARRLSCACDIFLRRLLPRARRGATTAWFASGWCVRAGAVHSSVRVQNNYSTPWVSNSSVRV
jgi:hypothetical protein